MGRRGRGEAGAWARAIARVLEQLIDRSGLSKVEIAERAGMSQSYLYARLRGELPFTLNDVEQLAQVLGVHPAVVSMMATGGDDPFSGSGPVAELDRQVLSDRVGRMLEAPLADGSTFSWDAFSNEAALVGLTKRTLDEISSGRSTEPVYTGWLVALTHHWGIDDRYLIDFADLEALEKASAQLDLRVALRDSGTESLSARMVGEVSPKALRAITSVIRELGNGEDRSS